MAVIELVVCIILGMPDVISRLLQIGSSLRDGMLVEAVETRLVDDIENSFLGVADSQRRVAGSGLAVSLVNCVGMAFT